MVQPQEMMSTLSRSDCSWNFSTVPAPKGRSPNTALVTETMGKVQGVLLLLAFRTPEPNKNDRSLLEKGQETAQTPPLPCLDLGSDHSYRNYPLGRF